MAARDAEAAVREAAWAEAQADRLRNDHARAAAALAAMDGTADPAGTAARRTHGPGRSRRPARSRPGRPARPRCGPAAIAWPSRPPTADAARREAEARRTRAETGIALAEERMARADRELEGLDARARDLAAERDRLRSDLATAVVAEAAARQALAELHAADAADRERLATAEQGASAARERLRAADDRLRTADRGELEARLGLDALRESVLVDLAGLGEPGLAHLAAVSGMALDTARPARSRTPDPDGRARIGRRRSDVDTDAADTAAFESALDAAADRWAAAPPTEDPARAGPAGPAPPAVPRARRGQPVRRRRVRRAQDPARDARDAGDRPADRDRAHARADRASSRR